MLTKKQIIENRIKWAKYLIEKRLYKAKEQLQVGLKRCCLGHGCKVLDIKNKKNIYGEVYYDGELSFAPKSFIELVGLRNEAGEFDNELLFNLETRKVETEYTLHSIKIANLASLNDDTDATPKEIGLFILSKVKTDKDSPFYNSWEK